MRTSVIHPATFKLDGGAMFGIIPKPLWERKIKPDEFNRIEMSLRIVLFETENKKILVDTGIGDYHGEKFDTQFDVKQKASPLLCALRDKKIEAEEITDIILTHLHFDHVGGLGHGKEGQVLLFPNATVHVHNKHFEYSQNATLRDRGSFHVKTFLPILKTYQDKGQLNLIDKNQGVLIEDGSEKISFITSFGHTPYMIHPYNTTHIFMADLVPMAHHIHIPWVMGYDIEPATTTKYKEEFYNFITKNDLSMIFEHDNEVVSSKIEFNGKKYISKDSVKSLKQEVQSLGS
jgi:glyoxylase-like metal-dependent hydrolase (beta-lactamase superfamily II)